MIIKDKMACDGCGVVIDVDQLDAKLELDENNEMIGDGSDVPLLCETCYGPEWSPAIEKGDRP